MPSLSLRRRSTRRTMSTTRHRQPAALLVAARSDGFRRHRYPGTGGGSLTYAYTRLTAAAPAAFRALNSEYTAGQATRDRYSVDLVPMGGSFQVDRVLANLGAAATNEVSFQMQQLLTAIRTTWQTAVINGDTSVDADGRDGLDKALTGTWTEYLPINKA